MNDVVRRARRGDPGAFDRLYEESAGRVYALCLRMSGDEVEARTLTQDVFVHVWQRLDSFRGDSAFSSWLHRVAVNVVLGEWRRRKRRRVDLFDDIDPVESPSTPSLDRAVDAKLDLERAIAGLPDGARIVLVLHEIEGYTHEEIGALCGIAPGTAKAQLHRARRLLKERYGE